MNGRHRMNTPNGTQTEMKNQTTTPTTATHGTWSDLSSLQQQFALAVRGLKEKKLARRNQQQPSSAIHAHHQHSASHPIGATQQLLHHAHQQHLHARHATNIIHRPPSHPTIQTATTTGLFFPELTFSSLSPVRPRSFLTGLPSSTESVNVNLLRTSADHSQHQQQQPPSGLPSHSNPPAPVSSSHISRRSLSIPRNHPRPVDGPDHMHSPIRQASPAAPHRTHDPSSSAASTVDELVQRQSAAAAARVSEHKARMRREQLRLDETATALKRERDALIQREKDAQYKRRSEIYALNHVKRLYHETLFDEFMVELTKKRSGGNGYQTTNQRIGSYHSEVASV